MKSSTKEKAKGMFHQVKGKIKETAGDLTDNPKMEVEGASEKMAGKFQENVGKVKKAWGN
jgi:uncharacterized protein YjbJ (UPF0337 family)